MRGPGGNEPADILTQQKDETVHLLGNAAAGVSVAVYRVGLCTGVCLKAWFTVAGAGPADSGGGLPWCQGNTSGPASVAQGSVSH